MGAKYKVSTVLTSATHVEDVQFSANISQFNTVTEHAVKPLDEDYLDFPIYPRRPRWQPDDSHKNCNRCNKKLVRRHHCRFCGLLFCSTCSCDKIPLPILGYNTGQRVCRSCFVAARYELDDANGCIVLDRPTLRTLFMGESQ